MSGSSDANEPHTVPEALNRYERRYRLLLDSMNQLFLIIDSQLNFTYVNRQFVQVMEYNPEQIIGQPVTLLVSEPMRQVAARSLRSLLQTGSSHEFVFRVYSRTGRKLVVRAKATPLAENDGALEIMILAEDLSENWRLAEALKNCEDSHRQITDNMLDMIFRLDTELKVEYVSPSIERILGYDPLEQIGKPVLHDIHPSDRKMARADLKRVLSSPNPQKVQYRIRHKKGHYIWLESVANPLLDRNGALSGFVVGCRDVTERVQFEKELLESRSRSEALFKLMQEGFTLWQVVRTKEGRVRDFRCVDANASFLKATGMKREQAIGRLNSQMFPRLEDAWLERLAEVANSCNPCSFEGYSLHLNRYFEIYAYCPGKDLLACLFVDATRRINTEQQLAKDRNWLSVVLSSVNEGIIATDVEGKVLFLNDKAASLMGWSEEETVGKHLSALFSEYQAIPARSGSKAGDEKTDSLSLTDNTINITRAGQRIILSNSSAPIKDASASIVGIVMVLTDITAQRIAQEQIEYLSFNDTLTGLYNRAYIEHISDALEQENQLPSSIILADVNGLKLTNDVFGHLSGDQLLKKVAQILRQSCRETDVIARWGGDEFLIILPRTATDTAGHIMERIRLNCLLASEDPIAISISLGVATRTSVKQSIDGTFRLAEDRMYNNKVREKSSSRETIIASLERNLWRRSYESPEHNQRIRELALKLARDMDLNDNDTENLALLASLHDIGKVGIESAVLVKKGELDEQEKKVMHKHPEIGYLMAQAIPELRAISEYILYSHESWDGSGFPRGLKGEEIPLLSRIINLVHSYDVAAYGVYKMPVGPEKAMEIIMEDRGRKFDPRLADLFLSGMIKARPH